MTSITVRAATRARKLLVSAASAVTPYEFFVSKKSQDPLRPRQCKILPLRYDYRARSQGMVNLMCLLEGNSLNLRLYTADDPRERWRINRLVLSAEIGRVERGDVLSLHLGRLSLTKNNQAVAVEAHLASVPNSRRYITVLKQTTRGNEYYRLCSHYLPFDNKQVGEDYYFGDDYTNYPTATYPTQALDLLRQYGCRNRLLDIGCALGVYTKAFLDEGFDAYGVDISPFAVDHARRLVGVGRAECADLDTDEIPFSGMFDTIWMWDVLEHFRAPNAVLEKVSKCARHGGMLFLHTSNCDSLSHRLFGRDWEGYSDYSHHGVDQVSCGSLRNWLIELGWEIVSFDCSGIWTSSADRVVLRLREVFGGVPELAVLLKEAELGDLITVVAAKRHQGGMG